VELTVLMPCLNEAETVATCVRKAGQFIADYGIAGEVLVADNGSTDGSQDLARGAGARVVAVPEPGYGNALLGGIKAARGQYVIMGDADDSYDFTALMPFIERLREGADLVMGNRFKGGIAPGAMPALHRYLGNPVLSYLGRLFFRAPIGDFHCGLRGFRRHSVMGLGLEASGMEFASEMVVRATLAGQRVEEVPTTLAPDGRSRHPHLRSWRDGWRHLRFLLLSSPRWLFFIPGTVVLAAGVVITALMIPVLHSVASTALDMDTLTTGCAMIVIGFQSVLFALFAQVYTTMEGLLPEDARISRLFGAWSVERGLRAGGLLAAAAVAGLAAQLARFHGAPLSHIGRESSLRVGLLSAATLILSFQVILGTFFLGILRIRWARGAGTGRVGATEPPSGFTGAELSMDLAGATQPETPAAQSSQV
jgi:Glycosyl transferase family 2